jgi:hypothetical protein
MMSPVSIALFLRGIRRRSRPRAPYKRIEWFAVSRRGAYSKTGSDKAGDHIIKTNGDRKLQEVRSYVGA